MAACNQLEAAVVVVQAAGVNDLELSVPTRHLQYDVVSDHLPGGVSSRVVADTPSILQCEVEESCTGLEGGFRLHALNRLLARELMRTRPRVVVLRGMHGCVLDLVRVTSIFDIPVILELSEIVKITISPWLQASMTGVAAVVYQEQPLPALINLAPHARHIHSSDLDMVVREYCDAAVSPAEKPFDYSLYEFMQRDPPLLMRMQAPLTQLFSGCSNVLDVGCGAGIFLQLLREQGIPASGVERNAVIAEYGRGMGFDIATADALEFLEERVAEFDGIYCSHFVEHLPIDGVERLLRGIAGALAPGGIAVLVFPDPESIRSQLLGFWRDPEHVRFYHPELVETLAMLFGLELEWSSYDAEPHQIGSFEMEPNPLQLARSDFSPPETPSPKLNWWSRLKSRFGGLPQARVSELEQRLANLETLLGRVVQCHEQALEALDERTQKLWAVNRTWAWQDNAVLKLRKRPEYGDIEP